MRLLNTRTLHFDWFDNPLDVDYAILSHVWSKRGEQSYDDVTAILIAAASAGSNSEAVPKISEKIKQCCMYALEDGFEYIWIDSCCIDKTSSAELSEAINSMYKWYESASQCYAYLHDVDDGDDPRARHSQFRDSEWFRRGWTLQELIAPSMLVFLTKSWKPIGSKHLLASVVHEITHIDIGILKGTESLDVVSVARRMSWASKRTTTRPEDEAYSLMGLFDIHMPAVYGEGSHAFIRLQEEILKKYPDDTLFGWGETLSIHEATDLELLGRTNDPPDHHGQLFASTPKLFESAGDLWPLAQENLMRRLGWSIDEAREYPPPSYTVTRYGVQAKLPLIIFPAHVDMSQSEIVLGLLLCEDVSRCLVALVMRPTAVYRQERSSRPEPPKSFMIGSRILRDGGAMDTCRMIKIKDSLLRRLIRSFRLHMSIVKTHLPRGGPLVRMNPKRNFKAHPHAHPGQCSVILPSWRTTALAANDIEVRKIIMDRPTITSSTWCARRHVFLLLHPTGAIRVVVGFCEHCTPSDVVPRPQVASLRVKVQSTVTAGPIPQTTPASLLFEPHGDRGMDNDHVLSWPWVHGQATMEFTLPVSDKSVRVMRLSVTFPESPRDLVLTLDVDFYELDVSRTASIISSVASEYDIYAEHSRRSGARAKAREAGTEVNRAYELDRGAHHSLRRDKGKGKATAEEVARFQEEMQQGVAQEDEEVFDEQAQIEGKGEVDDEVEIEEEEMEADGEEEDDDDDVEGDEDEDDGEQEEDDDDVEIAFLVRPRSPRPYSYAVSRFS